MFFLFLFLKLVSEQIFIPEGKLSQVVFLISQFLNLGCVFLQTVQGEEGMCKRKGMEKNVWGKEAGNEDQTVEWV